VHSPRRCLPLILILAVPLFAQEAKPRYNTIYAGGGIAMPQADLRGYMTKSAMFQLGYGYRFHKYFQADIAGIGVVEAAGIHFSLPTFTGDVKTGDIHVSDSELLVPFGGRAILPLAGGRIELFAGGGGVYLRYSEEAASKVVDCYGPGGPATCSVDQACPQCTSRSGWGGYGVAGANSALDRKRRVWVNVESRFVTGHTSGKLLGSGAPFQTKDQWTLIVGNVGVRF